MKQLVILLAILVLLPAPFALADDVFDEQAGAAGVRGVEDALPPEAGEILGDMKVTDALDAQGAISRLVEGIGAKLRGIVVSALKNAAIIVMAAMLSGIFAAAFPEKSGNYARLAGVLAISTVSVASVNTFIGMGAAVLDDLSVFSKMLLPCLTAAAAASGAITSAAAKYAATMLFMDIMMSVMKAVIMPLIYAFAAASIAEATVGGDALAGVTSLIKWLAKTALSIIVVVFIVYISLTGVIAGASDAAALRAAKVAISTALPVVGTILADAAGTVLSGAAMLKGAVGVFGVLVVAATCVIPVLKLGVNYLLFKVAAGLSGAVADKSVTKLLDGFASAFGLALGMTGVAAIMLFVSIVSMIKTVVV
ncbi:MAG: stage III sporulation protein AE [Oscillospiraceae bacterium]|jgi:stage III sporulation protein AE|nr:stage III sporulation protein AE [Oscillospiraceae bacterium]